MAEVPLPPPRPSEFVYSSENLDPQGQTSTSSTEAPTTPTGDPQSGDNQRTRTGESKNSISNGDLPWAVVLMPTTSAGQSGIGNNRHSLQPETWVVGFFADGDDCQQPVIVGVIPGGPGGASSSGGSSGEGDSSGGGVGADGKPLPNSGQSPGGASVSGSAEKVYTLFTNKGYTPAQSAGIVGNLMAENPKFNPTLTVNDVGAPATGLAMWRDRRPELMRQPNWNTVEGQVNFIDKELKTTEKIAYRMLMNSTTPEQAAEAFAHFERFRGWNAGKLRRTGSGFDPSNKDLQNRKRNARSVYDKMVGKTPKNNNPLSVTNNTVKAGPR